MTPQEGDAIVSALEDITAAVGTLLALVRAEIDREQPERDDGDLAGRLQEALDGSRCSRAAQDRRAAFHVVR